MNIAKAYFLGFKEAVRLPRPVFLIYFVNLLLAGMIILPFYGIMDAEFGQSTEVRSLLKDFDYSLFADFYNNSQAGISLLLGQIKWSMLIYWLLSIFLAGGIIRTLNQDKFTMTSFFSGAGYSFFKFLRISIIMLILQILLIMLVYILAFSIISSIADRANAEGGIIFTLVTAVIIHVLLMIILLTAGDYSKYYAALYDTSKTFKAIKGGFSYVFKNFFKTYTLYLMLIIVPALLIYAYFRIDAEIGTQTKMGILIMFFVQQAVVILTIWFRIWIYSSPLQMFTADFLKSEDVLQKIAIMNDWQTKASKQTKHVLADIMNFEEEKTDAGILTEKELLEKMKIEENSEEQQMKKMQTEIAEKISKNKEDKNKAKTAKTKDIKETKQDDNNENITDGDEKIFEL